MEQSLDSQHGQSTSRRAFLKQVAALTGVSAGTVLLAACGGASTTATAIPAAQQPTTPPTTGAAVTMAATASAAPTDAPATTPTGEAATAATTAATTASTQEAPTSASSAQDTTPKIVAAANAFLATLDDTKRTAVSFPYPSDQKTATAAAFGFRVGEQFGQSVWSNYPISDVIRPGLKMGDLSTAQREAALALLQATLSQGGYQKALHIMQADQLLAEGGTNYSAGTDNYVLGLFGAPSESTRWMLQFGGHHLAINATMQGTAIVLAPMLTGCQPSSYTSEGQTIRPLGAETDKAFALINALDATQQKQAILSYSVTDLVLGPGQDGKVLQPEGIAGSSLNAEQQAQLLDLAGEWVNVLNDAAAQAKMADIKSHVADTYFAWSGATTAGSAVYFRITGPTLHIEYANQGSLGGPGGGPGGTPNGTPSTSGTPDATPNGTPQGTPDATPSTSSTPNGTPNATPNGTPSSGASSGQQNPLETGGVNHIHTVYRDPTNEYGTGLS